MDYLIEYDKFIKKVLKEIPDIIRKIDENGIEVHQKTDRRDLVTEVDRGVEAFISEKIREISPDSQILGEETYDKEKFYDMKDLWVIDPIDGTTNFVKQRRDYCTLIAYFKDGEPKLSYIYDISNDLLYSAISKKGVFRNDVKLEKPENLEIKDALVAQDIRRMYGTKIFERAIKGSFATRAVGTSGLDGARVLTGQFGAYINFEGGPWDFAPYFLMSYELGLHFSKFDGSKLDINEYSGFILSTENIYKYLTER